MKRIAWGGESKDSGGTWRPSKRESWVCVAASEEHQRERARAVALVDENLRARYGQHSRWVEYVVIEEA